MRIRWSIRLMAVLGVLLAPLAADAGGGEPAAQIKKRLQKQIVGLRIDRVRPAPIAGLYEIVSGRNIFYSDASGRHLIANGHIFDTRDRRDLTAERLQEINRIDWKRLPLDLAIVSGDPKGLPMAVFTDPDCPFCRRLERELQRVKGVKVYSFLFPLTRIHPHAREHAEAIWCAKDRHKAMIDLMLHGKRLSKGRCKTPIDRILALGKRLQISGTPTLVAGDGRINAGAIPADRLKQWLRPR